MVTATEAADKRREARKKTGQAKQAATTKKVYSGDAKPPARALKPKARPTTVSSEGKANPKTYTPPKAKARTGYGTGPDYKAGDPKAKVNKGGLGISQTNRPRLQGTMEEGKKFLGYGYRDQNGQWIYPREDMKDGGGKGGSGGRFEGGISALSNASKATPYGSGIEASGLAKFVQDGGITGAIGKMFKQIFNPTTGQMETVEVDAAQAAPVNYGGGDNNGGGIATVAAPATKCPPGYMLDPKTNTCVPDMQAFANKGAVAIPGVVNPTIEQIIAAQNPQVAPQPLAPNLNSLMRLTGQGVTMAAEGGIMSLVEAEGGNEKTLISDAIAAIESGTEDEAAAIALAKFVQVHGEDALRDLVEKVQSGDYADTRERFANGENGIVKGPGDGSGTDDKVPATIDGEKDVLLAAGEMVLRKKTTDALEAALGEGGLDAVNAAEGDAPAVLRRLMNNVQAERQTA
jgi:hypothetical protein